MSKLIVLFLFFNLAFSQEPAPYLKINTDKLLAGKEKCVLKDYDFITGLFSSQIDSTVFKNIHAREDQFIKEEGGYIYLFISGKFAPAPQRGNIISLHIRNKKTRQGMTVFIRVARDLDFGMPVEINNLNFLPGNYYFDICREKPIGFPYSIDLALIKMPGSTCSKINNLILANKCS